MFLNRKQLIKHENNKLWPKSEKCVLALNHNLVFLFVDLCLQCYSFVYLFWHFRAPFVFTSFFVSVLFLDRWGFAISVNEVFALFKVFGYISCGALYHIFAAKPFLTLLVLQMHSFSSFKLGFFLSLL
jgi:hypothetical protein